MREVALQEPVGVVLPAGAHVAIRERLGVHADDVGGARRVVDRRALRPAGLAVTRVHEIGAVQVAVVVVTDVDAVVVRARRRGVDLDGIAVGEAPGVQGRVVPGGRPVEPVGDPLIGALIADERVARSVEVHPWVVAESCHAEPSTDPRPAAVGRLVHRVVGAEVRQVVHLCKHVVGVRRVDRD